MTTALPRALRQFNIDIRTQGDATAFLFTRCLIHPLHSVVVKEVHRCLSIVPDKTSHHVKTLATRWLMNVLTMRGSFP